MILTREQIDGIHEVAPWHHDDLIATALAYHDLRDAVREVQRQDREVLGPNDAGEVLAYVIGDLDAMLARVERFES